MQLRSLHHGDGTVLEVVAEVRSAVVAGVGSYQTGMDLKNVVIKDRQHRPANAVNAKDRDSA